MSRFARIVDAVVSLWQPQDGATTKLRESAGVTIDDDDEGWRRLSGDSGRDLSPLSQARMRDTALYLWDANLLANRIIELQVAYLLAEGVKLTPEDSADEGATETLQRFWDDPINQMDIKLAKKVRELAIFGEQCWPAFVNKHSGHVRLGYLDPGQIAQVIVDPDNPEQPIGIVTVKNKKGIATRYRIIVNGPEDDMFTTRTQEIRKSFSDGECFYFTINDLSLSRRGRSDLRALADWVDGYDQFLFGEVDRYQYLRAFVWDVTITGASPDEVEARAKKITPPKSGSVRVHNEGESWNAVTPDVKAGDTSEGARLFRNHVLGGATTPTHWFGGSDDVNRAGGESMGEPTFKVFSMRQKFIQHMLQQMGTYALRQKRIAENEGEPDWFDPKLKCKATFPEMTARDTTKYAAALGQVAAAVTLSIQAKLMTHETAVEIIAAVAGRLGVEIDPSEELEKAKKAAIAASEEDVFTGPDDTELDAAAGAARNVALQKQAA